MLRQLLIIRLQQLQRNVSMRDVCIVRHYAQEKRTDPTSPADETVRGTEVRGHPGFSLPDRKKHVPKARMDHAHEDPPLTEEEKEMFRANMAKNKKLQEGWMRSIGADELGYRDPDPDSGVNTAGTITGKVEEFLSNDKPRSMSGSSQGQSADDHRAKEALAKQQGYEPPQAHPPDKSPFQIFDMDESKPEVSTGYEKMAKPTVETSAKSTVRVLKEAVNTMMHGVNNAGQPEIEQKLREIEEAEGRKRT